MEDSAFSTEFCTFIHTAIKSVAAAELLLLLFKRQDRSWVVSELLGELSSEVSIGEADAGEHIEALRSHGLVEVDDEKRVRYRATSQALDTQVRTLAQAYNERPVTLIRIIYALRDSKVRSFADAFKFRKK